MRDLLRKGLDAYENRQERRDENLARSVSSNVEAMSHRPTLKKYVYLLSGVNLLFWASVLLRPYDVLTAFNKVAEINNKIVFLVLTSIFGIGMWLTYSIFRLKFPDLENRTESNEVMSAFADQENSTRKIRIWVASVAFGFLNLLGLAITEGLLVSN